MWGIPVNDSRHPPIRGHISCAMTAPLRNIQYQKLAGRTASGQLLNTHKEEVVSFCQSPA